MCREFFTHEGGRNTVEFFKETQSGDGLFVALKFESRSIAKEVLSRLQILLLYCSTVMCICIHVLLFICIVCIQFLMHCMHYQLY